LWRRLRGGQTSGVEDGEPSGTHGILRSIIFGLGFEFGKHAVIARLYQLTPDYVMTASIGDVVLLYIAQPRMTWIFLALVSAFKTDFSIIPAIIVEIILQIVTYVTLAKVSIHGQNSGFLAGKSGWQSLSSEGRLFYAGAFYMVFMDGMCILLFLFPLLASEKDGRESPLVWAFLFVLVGPWMGSWLFWAGFLQLFGDRYCPPDLIRQGIIWTSGNILGVIFTTG